MDSPALKTIFCEALVRNDGPERAAYLEGACRDDAALRAQVDALLRDHERIGRFLGTAKRSVSSSTETAADEPDDPPFGEITKAETQDRIAPASDGPRLEGPGSVVGPYKLLQSIGEGGMGTVYMAEQTQPVRRTVALKLIKAGMDSRHVLARFGAERQALALMDHPNIAKVFDAGTTETGRPYFVMELVKGIPITRFCDERRLTLHERLELAIPVCQAVQHAHQKGIIHRDLKPSNVLIALYDGKPVPKVIDFGVAKATGSRLTENTLFTEFGAVVGTLEYMSPEQAELNQLDIDTRSDIYSLGVLLYELLTGSTPLQRKRLNAAAFHELLRVIREEESPRPSLRLSTTEELPSIAACRHVEPRKLSGLVRGELDWIVMKALEKDRTRRYETANGLASDLRRFLNDEPVMAGPPSSWYRLRKFARRNRAGMAVGAFVAAALVAVASLVVLYADRQRLFAIEQGEATQKISALAGNLRTSLAESNRLLAIRNFDRAQTAFEKDQIGEGLLWMVESWRSAIEAGDPAGQRAARANLAAWRSHYPRLKAVLSHATSVRSAAFSPDSRTVISACNDGTAQLWDTTSAKKIGPSLQVGGQFPSFAFSRDGKTVLCITEAGTPRLWEAATGEALSLPLRMPTDVRFLAARFQDEGKIVLVGTEQESGNIMRFWDAATGQPVGRTLTHNGHICPPAFSPDGMIVLTGSDDGTARLWDAATGQPMRPALKLRGGVRCVVLSPDGKTILAGTRDGTARLWDAATGQPLGPPMRHDSEVRGLDLSPDGRTILSGCQDKEARLWDAATGQLIGLLQHQAGISAVAFSPDGMTILTGSFDGTVRLWDANWGRPVGQVLEIPSTDRVFSWSPERKVLVTFPQEPNYQRYVQLWDATTGQPIGERLAQPGGNEFVRFSTDGRFLVTTELNRIARLWNATTGVALGSPFPLPIKVLESGLAPDGTTLWVTGDDRAVWMFDGVTGKVRGRTSNLPGTAYLVAFSPDGKTFLTGLENGDLQLWDAATLLPLGDRFSNPGVLTDGVFSHDGKSVLLGHEDGAVWLFDLASHKPLIPPLKHLGPASGAFSPDGMTVITGSKDKTARVWDAATGQPIGPILRQPATVQNPAFIADGSTLFAGGPVARLFRVPLDLPDDLERVSIWIEVITGLRLDKQHGLIKVLDNAAWLERRERMGQLGGLLETEPERRLDPIIFGPDPTARARSFLDRKQWDAAEAAFDEARRARPFNISIVLERGDLYTNRGLWSEAAAYYAKAVKQYPDIAPLHEHLAVTRLLAGDLPGYRAACADMLDRFKPIDDSTAAVRVAYACTLAAKAVTDLPGLILVSERSTRWVASNERFVGAVLFRAGRPQEGLKRFEQAHRMSQPRAWDWLFLAMIQGRLGNADEARRMLAKAAQWIADADGTKQANGGDSQSGWLNEYEKPTVLLLRREAEYVILYDPIFPVDPFAQ